jgi:flagellar biosynthetic protein FlhB
MGAIAEQIRRLAAEHAVPIIERKELARELYRTVKVGSPIPAELYQVFVEIMAYVYRISGRMPRGLRR